MQGPAVATQVVVPQSAANPQVPAAANPQVPPTVNPQAPSPAAPEAKQDPEVPDHAASAPLGASSSARSNPPVTIHRQLLLRLVRALPIASESQLQAMLNVFDPSATPPPAAPNSNPPQNVPLSGASGIGYNHDKEIWEISPDAKTLKMILEVARHGIRNK